MIIIMIIWTQNTWDAIPRLAVEDYNKKVQYTKLWRREFREEVKFLE